MYDHGAPPDVNLTLVYLITLKKKTSRIKLDRSAYLLLKQSYVVFFYLMLENNI